jgi:hypothetical protein
MDTPYTDNANFKEWYRVNILHTMMRTLSCSKLIELSNSQLTELGTVCFPFVEGISYELNDKAKVMALWKILNKLSSISPFIVKEDY